VDELAVKFNTLCSLFIHL